MSLRQSPIALVYIKYIQISQQLILHIKHDMCDAPIFTTPPTSFTGDYPIPPACLISMLEASQSSWTWKSIHYAHLPTNQSQDAFPLWILKYWDEVSKLRKHIKLLWSRAEMFLVKIQNSSWCSPDAQQLCDSAQPAFFQMPWCGGTSGFMSLEPTVKLAAYLSKNWLETVHIDQQLDLLHIDLARAGSTQYQLLNPRVFEKLIIVYQHRE